MLNEERTNESFLHKGSPRLSRLLCLRWFEAEEVLDAWHAARKNIDRK